MCSSVAYTPSQMAAKEGELQAGELETILIPGDDFNVKRAFSMDIGKNYTVGGGGGVLVHI